MSGGLPLTPHPVKAIRARPANSLAMRGFAHALNVSTGSAPVLPDRLVRSGAAKGQTESDDPTVVRPVPTGAGVSAAMAYQDAQDEVVAGLLAVMPTPSHGALMSALDSLAAALGDRAAVQPSNRDFADRAQCPSGSRLPAADAAKE